MGKTQVIYFPLKSFVSMCNEKGKQQINAERTFNSKSVTSLKKKKKKEAKAKALHNSLRRSI